MNERFNFASNNGSEHTLETNTHTNGNGNGAGAAPLFNPPRESGLNGRFNTNGLNGAKPPTGKLNLPETGAKNETHSQSGPEKPGFPAGHPHRGEGQQVLQGSLTAFSPSSLLSLLSIQKQTGWLYLRNGSLSGYIFVEKGEVYDAGIGPVSSGALAVFQQFGWKQGEFFFEVGSVAPERRTIEVSLPVLQVRATLWLDNMNKYSQYIPSPSHLISIAAEPRSEVVIEPYQWAVLTKIVSRALSVAELAVELGQDLMTVTRIATELVKMGVAVVRPPEEQ